MTIGESGNYKSNLAKEEYVKTAVAFLLWLAERYETDINYAIGTICLYRILEMIPQHKLLSKHGIDCGKISEEGKNEYGEAFV
ncbi:MAG: hypothetical protein N3A57_07355 [Negativicutes bacterium]|nr:hypothetical protein [Negativicutes bacterium]